MEWTAAAGVDGKGVVVTGAAKGIGRSVAQAFAHYGAKVCLLDVDDYGLEETLSTLPAPRNHCIMNRDLRDVGGHPEIFRSACQLLGRVDVLAHLAAVLRRRTDVNDVTEDDWDVQIDTNLKVTFFLNRSSANAMKEEGHGGSIINFSSQGWWTGGFGGSVVYNASKGGVMTLTRGLARTFARDGITVNAVAPGFVDTPMMRDGSLTDEQIEQLAAQVPVGRMAYPDEVAGAVVFLASDHARYITGATINISGGFLMY